MNNANVAANLAMVKQRISDACERAGRHESEITLVAVSKTHSPAKIIEALRAGACDLGENRPEEAEGKIAAVNEHARAERLPLPRWHMIGHIQSRKARTVIESDYSLIHSVDSARLGIRLNHLAAQREVSLPILIEMNVAGKESRYGFDLSDETGTPSRETLSEIEQLLTLERLRCLGLMAIAPIVAQPAQARPYFRRVRRAFEFLRKQYPEQPWEHLSMGMTDDFEIAIEEGATIVRVGRAIFGDRDT